MGRVPATCFCIAGRWTQRDPIDYQDSINLYQFCGSNPVTKVDRDGQLAGYIAIVAHTLWANYGPALAIRSDRIIPPGQGITVFGVGFYNPNGCTSAEALALKRHEERHMRNTYLRVASPLTGVNGIVDEQLAMLETESVLSQAITTLEEKQKSPTGLTAQEMSQLDLYRTQHAVAHTLATDPDEAARYLKDPSNYTLPTR